MALLKKRLAEATATATAQGAAAVEVDNLKKEEAMGDVRAISAELNAAKSREAGAYTRPLFSST
jgi:hypothetical protein